MVTVILIDINDNAPMWLNPPVGDTVTIREVSQIQNDINYVRYDTILK